MVRREDRLLPPGTLGTGPDPGVCPACDARVCCRRSDRALRQPSEDQSSRALPRGRAAQSRLQEQRGRQRRRDCSATDGAVGRGMLRTLATRPQRKRFPTVSRLPLSRLGRLLGAPLRSNVGASAREFPRRPRAPASYHLHLLAGHRCANGGRYARCRLVCVSGRACQRERPAVGPRPPRVS
jgi:hypothetical protein